MICKIKVQVIYRSLEDSSPRENIVRLKLQYARTFVLFGLEIQQIYVKIPEFSLKIKTLTTPYAFLKLILIFRTVPDSIVKFLSYILAFLKSNYQLIFYSRLPQSQYAGLCFLLCWKLEQNILNPID